MLTLEKDSEILHKVAAKFRLLRRKAGLGQKEVFKATGLNIGSIEAARLNITITTLERLCSYYGLTLDEFFLDIDL